MSDRYNNDFRDRDCFETTYDVEEIFTQGQKAKKWYLKSCLS